MQARTRTARRLSLPLKLAVSCVALWLVTRQVEGAGLLRVLAASDWRPALAGALAYLLGQALSAYRWLLVARSVGFRCRLGELVRYYFVGMFFNMFGPATLGGDLVRGLYLAGDGGRRPAALNTVLFDRLVGLVMLVLVVSVAIAVFGGFGLPGAVSVVAAGGGLAIVTGWWALPSLARRLLRPDNPWRRLVELELAPLWRDRAMLARTAGLSVFFHVCQVGSVMLVGAAVDLEVPWSYYFVFHPLVSIFSALPISLAGFGIREMGYVYLLADVGGVPDETAVAFSVLWLGVLMFSTVAGGAVYLLAGEPIPGAARIGTDRWRPSPVRDDDVA